MGEFARYLRITAGSIHLVIHHQDFLLVVDGTQLPALERRTLPNLEI